MRCYAPDPAAGREANSAPPDLLAGFWGEERKGNRGKGKGGKRKGEGERKGNEKEVTVFKSRLKTFLLSQAFSSFSAH